jgi:S-adenosylmethionine synthetase
VARSNYLFTSESVSEGHPDKVADQISDAVVDLFLAKDPVARVACETMVTTNRIVLAGEVRSSVPVSNDEIEAAARATVRRIGYEQHGFHWNRAEFACHLHEQSAHIAQGVDESGNKDEGAGDQGIMFGYATDETPDLMPATLYYSHRILERLAADRHSKAVDFLEPDAKSQVTLQYEGGVPVRATALVVSTQHSAALSSDAGQARLRDYVKGVFADVLPSGWLPGDEGIFVNPTGLFEIGGPDGDAGLTGLMIIVDT